MRRAHPGFEIEREAEVILGIGRDAVVADERIGEAQDLPRSMMAGSDQNDGGHWAAAIASDTRALADNASRPQGGHAPPE